MSSFTLRLTIVGLDRLRSEDIFETTYVLTLNRTPISQCVLVFVAASLAISNQVAALIYERVNRFLFLLKSL